VIGTGVTWQEPFRRAFGRTVEVFYQEFAQYRATLTPRSWSDAPQTATQL
jgi:hypothetical protein